MIKNIHNKFNYSISAICRVLKFSKSTYYYQEKVKDETELIKEIIHLFTTDSRETYGARKLKYELAKKGFIVSRRKVRKLMSSLGLVSIYARIKKPRTIEKPNEDDGKNLVDRQFDDRYENEVTVSDLTYIRICGRWCYLCVLVDLCHRRIVGSAVGTAKNAELVLSALYSVDFDLRKLKIFHSDRGSEFKNRFLDEVFRVFNIQRSLSAKGTPHDNAVIESTINIIKTEFVKRQKFNSLEEFKLYWFDYVNWYNNVRIHGSLDYKTPNESQREKRA
jgi:transposase InsO family protein